MDSWSNQSEGNDLSTLTKDKAYVLPLFIDNPISVAAIIMTFDLPDENITMVTLGLMRYVKPELYVKTWEVDGQEISPDVITIALPIHRVKRVIMSGGPGPFRLVAKLERPVDLNPDAGMYALAFNVSTIGIKTYGAGALGHHQKMSQCSTTFDETTASLTIIAGSGLPAPTVTLRSSKAMRLMGN